MPIEGAPKTHYQSMDADALSVATMSYASVSDHKSHIIAPKVGSPVLCAHNVKITFTEWTVFTKQVRATI